MGKYIVPSSRVRIIALAIVIMLLYAGASLRMMQFQIVQGDDFLTQVQTNTTSSYDIQAARGDITDRYGRVLATTKAGYNVVLDWGFVDREHLNELIYKMIKLFREEGVEWVNECPIEYSGGNYVFQEEKESEITQMRQNALLDTYKKNMRKLQPLGGMQC